MLVIGIASTASYADEIIPHNPQPRWFKGNLHTHSLWSDGDDFPEMIAEWYRTQGYNFLALSDHNVLSEGTRWVKVARPQVPAALEKYLARFGPSWVETRGKQGTASHEVRLKPLDEFRTLVEERGKFIMIAAEEITDTAAGKHVHMNASNLKERIPPQGGSTVREAMAANLRAAEEQAKKSGREIVVHLNHPNFGYAITAEDLAEVVAEKYFEVYNGHPGVGHLGDKDHPPVDLIWDVANTIRIARLEAPPLYGLATDDSHNYHGHGNVSPGRGWVMVRATHLTPESLIRAMEKGDFYASSGVTLRDVAYDAAQRTIRIAIEADGEAKYTTQFIGTLADYDQKSEPRNDKAGKPIHTTRKYSVDVGKVLAIAEGLNPSYTLTGKELYARAVVTSTKPPVNPSFKGQFKQAWTQPVGWQERLKK